MLEIPNEQNRLRCSTRDSQEFYREILSVSRRSSALLNDFVGAARSRALLRRSWSLENSISETKLVIRAERGNYVNNDCVSNQTECLILFWLQSLRSSKRLQVHGMPLWMPSRLKSFHMFSLKEPLTAFSLYHLQSKLLSISTIFSLNRFHWKFQA